MITIVNYGLGNLGSVVNMFKRIGVPAKISSNLQEISGSEKILLPGVGAFDIAMNMIHRTGLFEVLNQLVLEKKIPVLGICLGMQIMTDSSEEGNMEGFHWIPGKTKRFIFPSEKNLKIPHMGWNSVRPVKASILSAGLPEDSKFYFVHSYYVSVVNQVNSVMKTIHGIEFDSVIQSDNIYGAQFHPEKSHKFGMQLLQNFALL
jgi:glutamine amidotransferase